MQHTSMEEILEGEPVTTSMFPMNQRPAVVLFDSGSSHSFMSQAFARKHDQLITELGFEFRVSLARADMSTRQMVRDETSEIGGHKFRVIL